MQFQSKDNVKKNDKLVSTPSRGGGRDSSVLLKDGYFGDLTDLERWGLLAPLLDLERRMDVVRYL